MRLLSYCTKLLKGWNECCECLSLNDGACACASTSAIGCTNNSASNITSNIARLIVLLLKFFRVTRCDCDTFSNISNNLEFKTQISLIILVFSAFRARNLSLRVLDSMFHAVIFIFTSRLVRCFCQTLLMFNVEHSFFQGFFFESGTALLLHTKH